MARLQWCIFILFLAPYFSEAAKILVVFPFPSKSHNILGEGFNKILVKAGHEVTYVTAFPNTNPTPNVKYVDISEIVALFPSDRSNLKGIVDKDITANDIKAFFKILTQLSNTTLMNENVQKLIHDPTQTFDLVIIEWMFSDVFAGLAALYDCPYIWFSSVDVHWVVLSLIDEAPNPAYTPDSLSSSLPPFNFGQRVQELFKQFFMGFVREFYLLGNERKIYDNVFGPLFAKKGRQLPTFDEVRYNASIMLGNSHVSLGKSIRLPQNYKPIGGYHIDPDVKPLPEDLKKIMDGAKNGVVYFSMGSNLKSKDLPIEIKNSLLKMFGGLKYTVIWKFEEQIDNLPKNVHILQWAPQPSILAHPNCKVFITHGGLLSATETVHYSVPIIGIPVLADQNTNVEIAVSKGYGLRVDLSYNMADDLKVAIEEIISNPKYKETVKALNLVYHDRPVPPATEMIHWVNHVLRTKGAPHLRSPALMLPWYQKMYLDLLALILSIIYVFTKLVKYCCCSRSKGFPDNKKKLPITDDKKKKK